MIFILLIIIFVAALGYMKLMEKNIASSEAKREEEKEEIKDLEKEIEVNLSK